MLNHYSYYCFYFQNCSMHIRICIMCVSSLYTNIWSILAQIYYGHIRLAMSYALKTIIVECMPGYLAVRIQL